MRIIGCDLHARQQTLAMLDTTTGEVVNLTLMREGHEVREFYSQLPHPDSRGHRSDRNDAVVSEPAGRVGNRMLGRGRHEDSCRGTPQAKT
jgi:hypothetical protein